VVRVTPQRRNNIALATEYYDKDKKFNYCDLGVSVRGYPNLPSLTILSRFAESLLNKTYETVIRASNRSSSA
jgi:hypothetical protein